MARVLAISSQVVRGHVGNSAAGFALQRMGHEVWVMPTVVLSNHPGHPHAAGTRITPETLRDMLSALGRNGWLGELDAVMTGYLPTAEHVRFAAETVTQLRGRRPELVVLVDPVLGDDPGGLYVAASAADAVREHLIPLADITTPNRFELAFLAAAEVTDSASAGLAAARLGPPQVLATSIPAAGEESLCNLLWQRAGSATREVPRLAAVPHGTGDLLAALYLGHVLRGTQPAEAMWRSVAGVAVAIQASQEADELQLVGSQERWSA